MTLLNSTDPAIADSLMLVLDSLTELEDANLYRQFGTSGLDQPQHDLTMDVRRNHEAAQAELVREKAQMLARPGRKGRRRVAPVIDLDERRIA